MLLMVSASVAISPLATSTSFLVRVAAGDRRDDLADAAHLIGEVGGHEVDVVGQILPSARDTGHPSLTAKLTLRADLAGDAGHLRRECPQLLDHRVDGVLELEDLALGFDGDLLGEVSVCDRRRDEGDVAHLGGQVPGQHVHAVGEILPRAGRSRNARLATELPLHADLSSHRGDLVRNVRSVLVMSLMVSARAAISPRASSTSF